MYALSHYTRGTLGLVNLFCRTWSISSLNGVKFYAEGGKWECRHQTSIAKIIGVSVNTVSRILYDNIKLSNRCDCLPENLCFDEFRSVNGIFTFIAIDTQTSSSN